MAFKISAVFLDYLKIYIIVDCMLITQLKLFEYLKVWRYSKT